VLVGYFSAKQKDYATLMDSGADALSVVGVRVVDRFVQRRGVSHGGVKKMTVPYSSRTLVSSGKVREIAAACETTGADAVIFLDDLTDHQRRTLSGIFGCPVAGISEFPPAV
jgi:50S ribosomal subunit-associated GTPase HflX